MLELKATQGSEIAVKLTDVHGNPATAQDPSFESSDETVLSIGPSTADPSNLLKAHIKAVGPLGASLVTFRADGDMGEGVVEIIATLDVIVNPGNAVTAEITAGTPTEEV